MRQSPAALLAFPGHWAFRHFADIIAPRIIVFSHLFPKPWCPSATASGWPSIWRKSLVGMNEPLATVAREIPTSPTGWLHQRIMKLLPRKLCDCKHNLSRHTIFRRTKHTNMQTLSMTQDRLFRPARLGNSAERYRDARLPAPLEREIEYRLKLSLASSINYEIQHLHV